MNALFTLWAFSAPASPAMGRFISLMFAWFALGGYWFLRFAALLVTGGFRGFASHVGWWVTPPVIVIATGALIVFSVPQLARFNLSQGAMESFAEEVMKGPVTSHPDRVGLYSIKRVDRFKGGMRFLVRGAGFLDDSGFAFSPSGKPPNLGEDLYYHLEGPWYLWEESW